MSIDTKFQVGSTLFWQRPGPYALEAVQLVGVTSYYAVDTPEPQIQFKIKTSQAGYVSIAAWKPEEMNTLFFTAEEAYATR